MTTTKNLKLSVIITAAGNGSRAGLGYNKVLAPLYGQPVLYHTFKKFCIPEVDEVVIAAAPEDMQVITQLAGPFGYKVTAGGDTRTQSVKNALDVVTGDIVLIHDGARPFLSKELVYRCINSVERFGSAVCALPLTDTVGVVRYGQVTSVPDRSGLVNLQTPQGFFTEDIKRAYRLAGEQSFYDDSSVYSRFISFPHVVEGERENIKLTYPSDFKREYMPLAHGGDRVGFGVDVHAYCGGTGVVLGGVRIPCDISVIAHSDGDALFHAVTDALLSGAGLKDIGHYFPENDAKWKNADSAHMCALALKEVKNAGYVPANISISVQAEKPRLAAYEDKMICNIANVLGISNECVSISAGTCEHLGFVGEGAGVAAYAYVSLKKIN